LKNAPEDFDKLLSWLDPDRERAGEKYETIRHQLIKIFTWQCALDPEGLADETINRVMLKLPDIAKTYIGDPSLYFYAVARNILRESHKGVSRAESAMAYYSIDKEDDARQEQLYNCLDKCMLTLEKEKRELLLAYYETSTQQRIGSRNKLAAQLGVQPLVLREYVFKIKTTLEKCIKKCMELHESKTD
jgi:DNA-directed RNA polymerase specialized sigma24 family protein